MILSAKSANSFAPLSLQGALPIRHYGYTAFSTVTKFSGKYAQGLPLKRIGRSAGAAP